MIRAVDVARTYRMGAVEVQALKGVSVTIGQGEYCAIVGPSGSGKSTLMNLLGLLDRPTSGVLEVSGRDVATLNDTELAGVRNATIGFVFQSFNLLARTSALDNVALPLVYRGTRASVRHERAHEALAAVGLGHRTGHKPSELSGGEQQRVAIARALVGEPALLLADEPTGNLDSVSGGEVMELFERLNHERGLAVVLVTHDLGIADRASRRIRVRDGLVSEVEGSASSGDAASPDTATRDTATRDAATRDAATPDAATRGGAASERATAGPATGSGATGDTHAIG